MTDQFANSILVGVDFSHNSDRAVQQALTLAERLQVAVELCYVGEPPPPVLANQDIDYLGFYEQQLRTLRDERIAGRVPCRTHLALGEPVPEILKLVDRLQPQMLVVGSHGRGAILRALLGSVSTDLCHYSPVPVLVVPTPERAQTVPRR